VLKTWASVQVFSNYAQELRLEMQEDFEHTEKVVHEEAEAGRQAARQAAKVCP